MRWIVIWTLSWDCQSYLWNLGATSQSNHGRCLWVWGGKPSKLFRQGFHGDSNVLDMSWDALLDRYYHWIAAYEGLWTSLGEGSLWCARWKEGWCFRINLPQLIAFSAFNAPSPGSSDHISLLHLSLCQSELCWDHATCLGSCLDGSHVPFPDSVFYCFAHLLLHRADFHPGSPLSCPLGVDCSGSLLEANCFPWCLWGFEVRSVCFEPPEFPCFLTFAAFIFLMKLFVHEDLWKLLLRFFLFEDFQVEVGALPVAFLDGYFLISCSPWWIYIWNFVVDPIDGTKLLMQFFVFGSTSRIGSRFTYKSPELEHVGDHPAEITSMLKLYFSLKRKFCNHKYFRVYEFKVFRISFT
jgi:hypothetical protein